jgi:hypothetical protein
MLFIFVWRNSVRCQGFHLLSPCLFRGEVPHLSFLRGNFSGGSLFFPLEFCLRVFSRRRKGASVKTHRRLVGSASRATASELLYSPVGFSTKSVMSRISIYHRSGVLYR